jgi:hypothetical protein
MQSADVTCEVLGSHVMSVVNVSHINRERPSLAKAGFVERGTPLNAWCRQNGVIRQNADRALLGQWTGPRATALVDRIAMAAGKGLRG